MKSRILIGKVFTGSGAAYHQHKSHMPEIRAKSGLLNLVGGTLNVRLTEPYVIRHDLTFTREEWERGEDTFFEHCRIRGKGALIMRTSTNFHGDTALELMAECKLRDTYGLEDEDDFEVEVFESFDSDKPGPSNV